MVLSSPAIHVISTGANQSNVLAVSVYATVNVIEGQTTQWRKEKRRSTKLYPES
jgi:hypothetical protein